MAGSILGNAVRRVEDPDLIVGRGSFVDNLRREGTLHAVFVRSPFAHARVTSVETGEAEQAPGVVAVLTGRDVERPVPSFGSANEDLVRTALATDKVRFVGEPVAMVVAETRAQAVDAAELVDVDYDDLPAVADVEAALADDAPLQFEELGGNVAKSRIDRNRDDPLVGSDRIVRLRLENNRLAVAPIEGHAILADPTQADSSGPLLTCWVATQHPHDARDMISKYTGLPPESVRVVAPHVGGAFGGKAGISTDHAAVVGAALHLGRPVAWTETRSEAMLSMHGRGQVQYAELGLTDEGKFVGLRFRMVGDCGAYAGFGGGFPMGSTRLMAQGTYVVPRMQYDAIAGLTNTSPVGAFRGAGRPEAAAMIERLVDAAAAELDLPPEELRRRNFIQPEDFPFTTHSKMTYDNGDYDLALREALRIVDVDGARAEQRRRREAGDIRQLGIGISTYVEITGFGGSEFGSVQIQPDGSAVVMSGTSAHGQGHATSFSMIAADRLGIPMSQISYTQSDTQLVRSGGGTGGSRSLQLGGNAVAAASDQVRERAVAVAARMLEAAPADVTLDDGAFSVLGVPGSTVSWAEVAAYAHEHDGGLGSDTDYEHEGATFPFGAHVSIVEVDTETGHVHPLRHVAVDDCGRVLNPMIVAGQQHGGVVQGMSQALWEEFVYDAEGTPLTSTFVDYTMPTAADTPSLEASSTETPTPLNPLGAKGIGESPTVGATPAVQNAVIDAVRHLGVKHIDLPCTPLRVWTAIRQAEQGRLPDPWREPPKVFEELADG